MCVASGRLAGDDEVKIGVLRLVVSSGGGRPTRAADPVSSAGVRVRIFLLLSGLECWGLNVWHFVGVVVVVVCFCFCFFLFWSFVLFRFLFVCLSEHYVPSLSPPINGFSRYVD